jgi:3,4-dihydroxy 2-butanone 4-phosphate synthase/GTP cyclohydrolase II
MALNSVEEIIQDIRLGKMVVLMDDEDRENEGDVIMAAEAVTPEHINFMVRHARGLICMPMNRERSDRLGLKLMVERNGSGFGTKFTTSIEAATGVTTGISAADRARTVQAAAARNATADDIVQPGHIFPLIAEQGGVLVRAGHTEAACDLARLGGFEATGVICEVLNEDGTMARRPDLEKFAAEHNLKIGTIADLIHYRVVNESTVEKISAASVATDHGEFVLHTYRDRLNNDVHFALVKGDVEPEKPVLARVQIPVTIRDLLGVRTPGRNGWSVGRCLERIAAEGTGVLVLLAGHETSEDLLASVEIVQGKKPIPQAPPVGDHRAYLTIGVGSQILRDIGARQLRLMGAPIKYNAISGFDLEVIEYISAE